MGSTDSSPSGCLAKAVPGRLGPVHHVVPANLPVPVARVSALCPATSRPHCGTGPADALVICDKPIRRLSYDRAADAMASAFIQVEDDDLKGGAQH